MEIKAIVSEWLRYQTANLDVSGAYPCGVIFLHP